MLLVYFWYILDIYGYFFLRMYQRCMVYVNIHICFWQYFTSLRFSLLRSRREKHRHLRYVCMYIYGCSVGFYLQNAHNVYSWRHKRQWRPCTPVQSLLKNTLEVGNHVFLQVQYLNAPNPCTVATIGRGVRVPFFLHPVVPAHLPCYSFVCLDVSWSRYLSIYSWFMHPSVHVYVHHTYLS